MIQFLITYSLLDLGSWVGLTVAFIAGLIRLGRGPMLMILIAVFGLRVLETYNPEVGLTPFPYLMGTFAVALAVIAHIVGLVISSIAWSMRHR